MASSCSTTKETLEGSKDIFLAAKGNMTDLFIKEFHAYIAAQSEECLMISELTPAGSVEIELPKGPGIDARVFFVRVVGQDSAVTAQAREKYPRMPQAYNNLAARETREGYLRWWLIFP